MYITLPSTINHQTTQLHLRAMHISYSYMLGPCTITSMLKYHTSHFSAFYSHDSLLALHELWQWSHNFGKGQELLPSHLYALQNQFLLLESRTDSEIFVYLQACFKHSNLRVLSLSQSARSLTHNRNYTAYWRSK